MFETFDTSVRMVLENPEDKMALRILQKHIERRLGTEYMDTTPYIHVSTIIEALTEEGFLGVNTRKFYLKSFERHCDRMVKKEIYSFSFLSIVKRDQFDDNPVRTSSRSTYGNPFSQEIAINLNIYFPDVFEDAYLKCNSIYNYRYGEDGEPREHRESKVFLSSLKGVKDWVSLFKRYIEAHEKQIT